MHAYAGGRDRLSGKLNGIACTIVVYVQMIHCSGSIDVLAEERPRQCVPVITQLIRTETIYGQSEIMYVIRCMQATSNAFLLLIMDGTRRLVA